MKEREGTARSGPAWVRTADGNWVNLGSIVQLRCRQDLDERWAVIGLTGDGYRVDLRRGFDSLREAERWITKLLGSRR